MKEVKNVRQWFQLGNGQGLLCVGFATLSFVLNHLLHFQDKMQVLKHLSLPVLVLVASLAVYSASGSAGRYRAMHGAWSCNNNMLDFSWKQKIA